MDNYDPDRFPNFAASAYYDVVLEPRDVLYIPPRSWTFSRNVSYGASMQVLFETE